MTTKCPSAEEFLVKEKRGTQVCTGDSHALQNGAIWISWQPHYSVITDWQPLLDSASDVYHSTHLSPTTHASGFESLSDQVASPEITLRGSFGSHPTIPSTAPAWKSKPLTIQVWSGIETAGLVSLPSPDLALRSLLPTPSCYLGDPLWRCLKRHT